MPVGIFKIAGVTSPKRFLSRFHQRGASIYRLLQHDVYFFLTTHIMSKGNTSKLATLTGIQPDILGK